jgi:LysR family transcriptional regulator for metE and metH
MESPLELRHLRTLRALKASGSLTRASELLHLTQSALSHQLKVVEDWAGSPLFARKSQPLTFSPAGERLLVLAEQILPQVEAAARDLSRLAGASAGSLRIAVECHTCFDWLLPALSRFRPRWPEVDFDFATGFHSRPAQLVIEDKADLAILGDSAPVPGLTLMPLFRSGIVGVLAEDHPLAAKPWLDAADFSDEILITYPIPDDMLDVVRQVLAPAGIVPARRTSELTNAILQLVAARKGIAALPVWVVHSYLDHHGLVLRPITERGLWGDLYAAVPTNRADEPYLNDFAAIVRETCYLTLPEIELL